MSLTDLGNQITRADTEAAAKVHAFLHVPPIERFTRNTKDACCLVIAIEEDMVALGVAQKQKSRAHQGFQRSAEQANMGKDRLVVPAGVSLDWKPSDGGKVERWKVSIFVGRVKLIQR